MEPTIHSEHNLVADEQDHQGSRYGNYWYWFRGNLSLAYPEIAVIARV